MSEWRSVVGFEGLYEVHPSGQIRRVRPYKSTQAGRILSPGTVKGYARAVLCKGSQGRERQFVHRVVCEAFLGPKPDGMQINHKDGNKLNNSLDNLEYVTPKENTAHAFSKGLRKPYRGSRENYWKLSVPQVREVQQQLADQVPVETIAATFNVAHWTIRRIRAGRYRGAEPSCMRSMAQPLSQDPSASRTRHGAEEIMMRSTTKDGGR